jgi:hypothetical protein
MKVKCKDGKFRVFGKILSDYWHKEDNYYCQGCFKQPIKESKLAEHVCAKETP